MAKKGKPGNVGNQQKAFYIIKAPSVNALSFLETAKKLPIWYLTIWPQEKIKLLSSFNGKFSLIPSRIAL